MPDLTSAAQQANSATTPAPLKVITIRRLPSTPEGTFGVMLKEKKQLDGSVANVPFACTVELPWKNNQKDVSCVPPGEYLCKRRYSDHFKEEVFGLTNVAGRDDILIHVANVIGDIEGCIGIGNGFGVLDGITAIQSSKATFLSFMLMFSGIDTFKLVII